MNGNLLTRCNPQLKAFGMSNVTVFSFKDVRVDRIS